MENRVMMTAEDMKLPQILVREPFAEFLRADQEEYSFPISLLDVVRFAGHACPSMVGAFVISQRAVRELFPETGVLIRGQVSVEMGSAVDRGATGPISNVFSMIFGAWEKSGFGGIQGNFVRRGLLSYEVSDLPPGTYRFKHLGTGKTIEVFYDSSQVDLKGDLSDLSFQEVWRMKIRRIVMEADKVLMVKVSQSAH
ncbi:hypothetical protein EZJ49_03415 [Bdellovibrio bacteriovorus]|uniref:hypothetical protein n=1 Tax=Bdellovibrio bacteriovorus TaxID=959 RepID=UPI0021D1BBF3|nr:hypothetical protein [Bdellovibrio bacteriovorus]UXR65298.1 hypothetical protein EZJ49_03415 [Bdellovibrio bacteriovorus]